MAIENPPFIVDSPIKHIKTSIFRGLSIASWLGASLLCPRCPGGEDVPSGNLLCSYGKSPIYAH